MGGAGRRVFAKEDAVILRTCSDWTREGRPRRRDDPRTPSSISTSSFDPSTSSRYLDSSLRIGLIGTWCYRYRANVYLTAFGRFAYACVRACVWSLSLKLLVRFPDPEGGGHGRYRSFRAFVISPSLSLSALVGVISSLDREGCLLSIRHAG